MREDQDGRQGTKTSSAEPLLATFVRECVRGPLAALRAVLVDAADGTPEAAREALANSVHELAWLDRSIQALVDHCRPPRLHASPCRAAEVIRTALAPLEAASRARICVANEGDLDLELDAGQLGHCLSRALEAIVACGASQVLVTARRATDGVRLHVYADDVAHADPRARNRRDFHLAALADETARAGGSADFSYEPACGTRFRARLHARRLAEVAS